MAIHSIKSGDSLPPAQAKPKECPKCGDKVFEQYPNGFVNEINIVTIQTPNGWRVKEHWHCPGCGYHEDGSHEVDTHGVRINRKPNSSQVSKKKKRNKK